MHKHHNTLGLAKAPHGNSDVAAIANQRPVQPVTLLRPHAAARARCVRRTGREGSAGCGPENSLHKGLRPIYRTSLPHGDFQ